MEIRTMVLFFLPCKVQRQALGGKSFNNDMNLSKAIRISFVRK